MDNKPTLLDLFCGAGGAARGYQLAGFDVTGVDIKPQPRYAGDCFVLGDALEYTAAHGHEYDVIHASPPCQFGSRELSFEQRASHPNLIPETRRILKLIGKYFIIENIEDNRRLLINPIKLCGSGLGLQIFRHRYFELGGFDIWFLPPCQHDFEPVYITGSHKSKGKSRDDTVEERRRASGIDWMSDKELDQAIPPAYTHYIGQQLMRVLR